MTWIEAIIIAIVEGLTEFLPVSSTGHMMITEGLLGVESTPFVKAFTIIIQFGAILSVVVLYWKRFFKLNDVKIFDEEVKSLQGGSKWWLALKNFLKKYDFYWKLFIAFLPAAFFGLLLSDKIDDLLENVQVVAIMLIVGGIFMIFADKIFNKPKENQEVNEPKALKIGLFQCIAMIPGVSRSMASIVGGMSQGLTRKNAAEFSFFLAVPTMFAATGYKLLKLILEDKQMLLDNMGSLIVGNVVAFVVALISIKFFINFVSKYGFKFFGYYRIVAGALVLILMKYGISFAI